MRVQRRTPFNGPGSLPNVAVSHDRERLGAGVLGHRSRDSLRAFWVTPRCRSVWFDPLA